FACGGFPSESSQPPRRGSIPRQPAIFGRMRFRVLGHFALMELKKVSAFPRLAWFEAIERRTPASRGATGQSDPLPATVPAAVALVEKLADGARQLARRVGLLQHRVAGEGFHLRRVGIVPGAEKHRDAGTERKNPLVGIRPAKTRHHHVKNEKVHFACPLPEEFESLLAVASRKHGI